MSFTSAVDGAVGRPVGTLIVRKGDDVRIGSLRPLSSTVDPAERLARNALLDAQREQAVRESSWPELDYDDLERGPFRTLKHGPSGTVYRRHRGSVDAAFPSAVVAFTRGDGELVLLEKA